MLEQGSCQLFTEHKEMKKGIPLVSFFLRPKCSTWNSEQGKGDSERAGERREANFASISIRVIYVDISGCNSLVSL
jgi:hypothetical protein